VLDRTTTENAVITAGIGKTGERKRSIEQISDDIRDKMKDIPGAIIELTDSGNVMGFSLGSSEVEIRIFGDDMDKLRRMSEELSSMVRGIEGIRDVACSVEEEALEAVIHINRSKAALYHLTTAQVADSVITAVNGSVATRYQYRGSQIDVRVSSGAMGTHSIEALKSVALKSVLGVSIPLSEIAEIKIEKTPATILRNNQRRCVTITAGTNGRALNHITRDIEKRFKHYTFPTGYSYGFGGQQEELFKSFDDLALALVLAVFIVYMLLAAQLESFIHPFTIMLTVPLSLTGGLIALLLTGYTLSIPSFIGIIILVGIVVNNTIVLIDTINRLKEEGHTREEAVLEAGPLRLRPILMTTLTTLLGMLPMALEKGDGSEIQSPLAVVVIGGLMVATFITLLVIPSIYLVFDQWIGAFKEKKQRRTLKLLR
jgi:HAE1 family hydrophobic/amphiphilic exporter-1